MHSSINNHSNSGSLLLKRLSVFMWNCSLIIALSVVGGIEHPISLYAAICTIVCQNVRPLSVKQKR